MVVLPLLKLGTLALKTLSKPIAARIKVEAGRHPKFRNFIISMAQGNHRITTQTQRRIYGHATDVEIRPLNEEKAVQAAVDLLGELFVFSVAGAAVIFEVQRSSRSEAKKEELRRQEMEVIEKLGVRLITWMGKGSKSGACKSASHHLFKDRAKIRVDDLQGMFSDLQSARKESRKIDVAVLEEQVHQMLREWKAELNEPSPASSLQGGSLDSFSSDIYRLLQLCEEEDDATSALAAPKAELDSQKADEAAVFQEGFVATQVPEDQSKNSPAGANSMGANNLGLVTQLDYHPFDLHQDFEHQYFTVFDGTGLCGEDGLPHITGFAQNFCPPPAAFLGPKCALWDCPRPAQRSEWCQTSQDYCSGYHSTIAPAEGYPGMAPVLRPGGIGLKDNLLFAALSAKAQGKDVGVPECEGAATTKSPWKAPELFDLVVLEGETIREWLFFDKPRRAFESGNRKQRSLPDYNGRGWHESRKQVMNEYGGLKRSYYMDPQPMKIYEWHLYEYEINKYDACALYRLELKLVDGKKSLKGRIATDSVADLQKQMKKLSAEFPSDKQRAVKGGAKVTSKDGVGSIYSTPNRMPPTGEGFDYSTGASYEYLVDNLNGYYIT